MYFKNVANNKYLRVGLVSYGKLIICYVALHNNCFASAALIYSSISLKRNSLYGEVPTQLEWNYLGLSKIYVQFNTVITNMYGV